MKTFRITNTMSGHCFGTYQAADEVGALEALAADAGYSSLAAQREVAPAKDGEILVSEVTISVINPFSGATVEKPVAEIDPKVIANLMTDEELYACEGQGNDDAEWVEFVASHVGPQRMGVMVLGS